MMIVHELGHVLAAWLTGGGVERVVLHPLRLSRTDVAPNPHPHVVVWAGPLLGVLLPVGVWAACRMRGFAHAYLLRFFAGFCLIANGVYLGMGGFDHIGDAGDMLAHGSPHWLLWLFGLGAVPAGLWLWHGQGVHFGLGGAAHTHLRSVAYWTFGLALAIILCECLFFAVSM